MALVEPGPIVVDIRGSIGGVTYARNPAGLYARERTSPSQPESAERDLRQAALTALSQAWSGTLTEAQRLTWRTYAAKHPMPNRLGALRYLDGLRHFIRCNAQHYRVTAAITHTTAPGGPPTHPPLFLVYGVTGPNRLNFGIPPLNYDPPPTDMHLYAYGGIQVTQGVNFYNGPWRYLDHSTWNGAAWSDPPLGGILPYDLTGGHRVYGRLVAVLAGGETSIAGFAFDNT